MSTSSPTREERIVEVFSATFGPEIAASPAAFTRKFHKMAANPFAFYRGSACLFYADVSERSDPFVDERTSRIWIHGDLHAENFGTYMDARGHLVFNVNDFDEAYIGPFLWDLLRFSASLALIGRTKALSDEVIRRLVTTFADSYLAGIDRVHAQGHRPRTLTLDRMDGVLLEVLQQARLRTRIRLLDSVTVVEGYERRFATASNTHELGEAERARVLDAFEAYAATTTGGPGRTAWRVKDVIGRSGVGIGSAGLPSYNILLEGHTQALENDVVLFMKRGQKPAVSQHVDAPDARRYFQHEGHRTAISQRALQDSADPWLGWTELDGQGQVVAEVSPYATDLDWSEVDQPDLLARAVEHLGDAVATMHTVADHQGDDTLLGFCAGDAIADSVAGQEGEFRRLLVDFAHDYAAQTWRDHQSFVDLFRNGELRAR